MAKTIHFHFNFTEVCSQYSIDNKSIDLMFQPQRDISTSVDQDPGRHMATLGLNED